MAECPCPNCRFRSYQRTRSASSPGDLNEDSGSSETEAGSERCDCADGRGGGCACRSGVFGGAERRGAGRRGGTERRGVGRGGIGRGRCRAGRLPSNQTRHNLGNSDCHNDDNGDRPVDPTQLTWSRAQAGKSTGLKTDGVLGAHSISNYSQVTGQIHRVETLQ
ncbi:hypothetical protein BELL_0233g00030 [Botrytis elliptica]|uniref:Uncharacterized protein n=1 Tax=Botrytis elliptica TaxID=278938 RepID=A0A4Z1K150_9HELO|nr:hypothetical protein BELL_0233g00030 [Botrytis elliptica]